MVISIQGSENLVVSLDVALDMIMVGEEGLILLLWFVSFYDSVFLLYKDTA